jgi:hypothetical protein
MNCRSCNTRLPSGTNVCPNCGHVERAGGFIDRPEERPGTPDSSASRLAPSSLGPDAEVELSLESAVGKTERPPKSVQKKQVKKVKKVKKVEKAAAPPPERPPASPPSDGMVIDASRIRQLLGDQPELIEDGLAVHTDDSGSEIGLDFDTDVGSIDLLGRGADDAFVAVLIARPGEASASVPEILQRMGWIRKHLVKGAQQVRGIVLLEEVDDELGYAAAAVADTVEFMTCRIAISFDRVDV